MASVALLLVLVGINTPVLVCGLIIVYKADEVTRRPVEIKTIEDESVWLDNVNRVVSKRRVMQPSVGNRIIDKVFIQHHGSDICYSKLQPPLNTKVPWAILTSADETICNNTHRITAAQNAGYIGLLLYSEPGITPSLSRYKFETAKPAIAKTKIKIPVFFVSNEDGEYLRELFAEDGHEIIHFIRLEKNVSWTSWALTLISPLVKVLAYICVLDLILAFMTVIWELLTGWINAPWIMSFIYIVLWLPFVLLFFTATTRRRMPHSFSENDNSYSSTNFDERSNQEWEDSDSGSRSFRSNYVGRSELLKYYEVLGIPENSNFDQARATYLNLSKRYHPGKICCKVEVVSAVYDLLSCYFKYTDKSDGLGDREVAANTEKMKEITEAWRNLKIHLQSSYTDQR